MGKNFYYYCNYSVKFLILILLTCSFYQAQAQRRSPKGINYDGDSWQSGSRGGGGGGGGGGGSRGSGEYSGWSVALNLGYDVPSGNLGKAFKAAPTYGLSILNDWHHFTFNLSAGYLAYASKLGTVYYDPEDPSVGYFKQGPFKIYQFYAGAAYNINLGDKLRVYPGVNFGAYYTRDNYEIVDEEEKTTVVATVQNGYLAAKLGFIYMVTDHIGAGLEGKTNLFAPTGNARENGTGGYGSYTGNLRLTYNF